MSSRRATIAQAAADLLAAASGTSPLSSLTFDVARKYVPAAEQQKLNNLTLTVCPIGAEVRTIKMRNAIEKLYQFEVGIQKRLTTACDPETADGNPEIDSLMLFAEQVAAYFEPTGAARGVIGTSQWVASEVALTYNPEHLQQLRVFTTHVIFTVRYY